MNDTQGSGRSESHRFQYRLERDRIIASTHGFERHNRISVLAARYAGTRGCRLPSLMPDVTMRIGKLRVPPLILHRELLRTRPDQVDVDFFSTCALFNCVLDHLRAGDREFLAAIEPNHRLELLSYALVEHLLNPEPLDFLIELYRMIHRDSPTDRTTLVEWLVSASLLSAFRSPDEEFSAVARRARHFFGAFELTPLPDHWIARSAHSLDLPLHNLPDDPGPFSAEIDRKIPTAPLPFVPDPAGPSRLEAIRFLGGSGIGQSSILLRFTTGNLLLDFGMADSTGMHWPRFEELRSIDAILLTHAHLDHAGGLIGLYRKRNTSRADWYATPQTRTVTDIMFEDSMKIEARATGREEQAHRVLERIDSRYRPCEWHAPFQPLPGVTVTAFPAGHVHGAASFLIETTEERLFYTGDYCARPLFSAMPLAWPDPGMLRSVDRLIIEGTYAGRPGNMPGSDDARRELLGRIESIASRGSRALIPVMSLGRAQEVIACLRGSNLKACVLGMAARITRRIGFDTPANVHVDPDCPRYAYEELLAYHDAVIASAGCLQGGPSRGILEMVFPYPIEPILTGYQFAITPGRHLEVTDSCPRIPFSAHASDAEFRHALDLFPNARKYVVHFPGDPEELMRRYEVHVPVGGETIRVQNGRR